MNIEELYDELKVLIRDSDIDKIHLFYQKFGYNPYITLERYRQVSADLKETILKLKRINNETKD